VIVDGDEWQDNFKRGIVISYNFFTGFHTIRIDSLEELDFYGRGILKARR
jgi:hypothetical protein